MSTYLPKIILGVLLESDEPITKTRLTKLCFLLRQETTIKQRCSFCDFLPYKYGPYSFTLNRHLQTLQGSGDVIGERLHIPPHSIQRAKEEYWALPSGVRHAIYYTVGKYRTLSDNALIDEVYYHYPEYTMLSERYNFHQNRDVALPAIYTIGYEGKSVDAFLNTLIQKGILRLLDVRHNPLSRRYGFSKKTLEILCSNVGIEYLHLPDLGIPSDKRKALDSEGDRRRLLDWYESHRLPFQQEMFNCLVSLLGEKSGVLTCYEANSNQCHRGRLANAVAQMSELSVCHLEVSDS